MFEVNKETTWWSPKPMTVIDARDLSMLGVVPSQLQPVSYTLHVYLSGSDDKKEFFYNNLELLNEVLAPLGLTWKD